MSFSFSFVTKEAILNVLCKFNPKKACQDCDIPVKIIKENLDDFSNFVYNNCILVMVEKWRQCLDNGEVSEALLTDLSKVFDCILHSLLITKVSAYGFDYNSLQM